MHHTVRDLEKLLLMAFRRIYTENQEQNCRAQRFSNSEILSKMSMFKAVVKSLVLDYPSNVWVWGPSCGVSLKTSQTLAGYSHNSMPQLP